MCTPRSAGASVRLRSRRWPAPQRSAGEEAPHVALRVVELLDPAVHVAAVLAGECIESVADRAFHGFPTRDDLRVGGGLRVRGGLPRLRPADHLGEDPLALLARPVLRERAQRRDREVVRLRALEGREERVDGAVGSERPDREREEETRRACDRAARHGAAASAGSRPTGLAGGLASTRSRTSTTSTPSGRAMTGFISISAISGKSSTRRER